MADLTNEDLQALRKLHEAAMPAPWLATSEYLGHGWLVCSFGDGRIGGDWHVTASKDGRGGAENDAALVVAARNVLPRLLDAVERLRAENAKLREGLAWLAKAVGFLDKCNSDRIKAKETGAMVDAWEWLEEAAREACLGITPEDIAEGERQVKSGKWVTLVDLREEFWQEDDGA